MAAERNKFLSYVFEIAKISSQDSVQLDLHQIDGKYLYSDEIMEQKDIYQMNYKKVRSARLCIIDMEKQSFQDIFAKALTHMSSYPVLEELTLQLPQQKCTKVTKLIERFKKIVKLHIDLSQYKYCQEEKIFEQISKLEKLQNLKMEISPDSSVESLYQITFGKNLQKLEFNLNLSLIPSLLESLSRCDLPELKCLDIQSNFTKKDEMEQIEKVMQNLKSNTYFENLNIEKLIFPLSNQMNELIYESMSKIESLKDIQLMYQTEQDLKLLKYIPKSCVVIKLTNRSSGFRKEDPVIFTAKNIKELLLSSREVLENKYSLQFDFPVQMDAQLAEALAQLNAYILNFNQEISHQLKMLILEKSSKTIYIDNLNYYQRYNENNNKKKIDLQFYENTVMEIIIYEAFMKDFMTYSPYKILADLHFE